MSVVIAVVALELFSMKYTTNFISNTWLYDRTVSSTNKTSSFFRWEGRLRILEQFLQNMDNVAFTLLWCSFLQAHCCQRRRESRTVKAGWACSISHQRVDWRTISQNQRSATSIHIKPEIGRVGSYVWYGVCHPKCWTVDEVLVWDSPEAWLGSGCWEGFEFMQNGAEKDVGSPDTHETIPRNPKRHFDKGMVVGGELIVVLWPAVQHHCHAAVVYCRFQQYHIFEDFGLALGTIILWLM